MDPTILVLVSEIEKLPDSDQKVTVRKIAGDLLNSAPTETEQELFERVRGYAASIMGDVLDNRFERAKRRAKRWLDLYQCSGVKP